MNAASRDPTTLQALVDALEHGAAATEAGAPSLRAALFATARARTYAPADHDALRRIAVAVANFDVATAREFTVAYGALCAAGWAAPVPLSWPRRTAGDRLRVMTLHSPVAPLDAATLAALASLPRESFAITMASIGDATLPAGDGTASLALPAQPDAATAKAIGAGDFDVLIDLAGPRPRRDHCSRSARRGRSGPSRRCHCRTPHHSSIASSTARTAWRRR